MATATLSPAAVAANDKALNEAMAAASISEKAVTELEEGEIADGASDEDDGKVRTVFDDPVHFNVKHPLCTVWALYFDSPQSKKLPKTPTTAPATPQITHGGWMEDIRKVVEFQSVEEFWGLYNNIVPPSQLPAKANYYLFRNSIMPAWEDPENKAGGKWSIQLPRDKSKATIDQMWLYTMLAAIGETFEETAKDKPVATDLITGIIIQSRPAFYRISIWTREAPETTTETDPLFARILSVGRTFKTSVLGYEVDKKIASTTLQTEVTFESHNESQKKNGKKFVL